LSVHVDKCFNVYSNSCRSFMLITVQNFVVNSNFPCQKFWVIIRMKLSFLMFITSIINFWSFGLQFLESECSGRAICVFRNVCLQCALLFLRKPHIKSGKYKYYNTECINKYYIFFHFKCTLRSDIYGIPIWHL